MQTDQLLGDYATTDQRFGEQDEIAEYIFGLVAKRDDEPMDETKSLAWQRGWASNLRRRKENSSWQPGK
jgi:hypothetical protein